MRIHGGKQFNKNKNKFLLYNALVDKQVVRLLPTNFEVTKKFLIVIQQGGGVSGRVRVVET